MTNYTIIASPSGAPTIDLVRRDSDGAIIPADPGNGDWQCYQAWCAAGNTPTPAPVAAPLVSETMSSRQFFQQIALENLITQDEALAYVQTGTLPKLFRDAIATLPTAQQFGIKMAIIGANTFERHNPTTETLGAMLNQTGAQLDALWASAAALI